MEGTGCLVSKSRNMKCRLGLVFDLVMLTLSPTLFLSLLSMYSLVHNTISAMSAGTRGCMSDSQCQVGTVCKNMTTYTECHPCGTGECQDAEEERNGLCCDEHGVCGVPRPLMSVFNKKLGLCEGSIATSWGDPHIVSFDNLKWDCQGQGDYVITDSPVLKVHARYDSMKTRDYKLSQAKAFAVQTGGHTPEKSDDGTLHISFPEHYVDFVKDPNKPDYKDSFDTHEYYHRGFAHDCPVHIRYESFDKDTGMKVVENVKLDEANGNIVVNQSFLQTRGGIATAKVTKSTTGETRMIVNFVSGASIELRIHGGGSSAWNGCVMSVKVCLPDILNPPMMHPYEHIRGVLGYPDGQKMNDWIDSNNPSGKPVEVINSGSDRKKKQWEYCVAHWCIRNKKESILRYKEDEVEVDFIHETDVDLSEYLENSDYYISQCDSPWPGDIDVTECKDFSSLDKFLPEDKSFDYYMTEMNGIFPPDWLAGCVECHFDPHLCKIELEVLEEIQLTANAGVDGDPEPTLDPIVVTCDNLGTDLSHPTGPTPFSGVPVQSCGEKCIGYDNSYGMFVGANLTINKAEAIEGRLYVGENLVIKNSAPDISWATCGSHLCPTMMSRVLQVCGDLSISTPNDEQVSILPVEGEAGTTTFGGTYAENGIAETQPKLLLTNGETKKVDAAEVCPIKDELLTPLKNKSIYWATEAFKDYSLGVTGEVTVDDSTGLITLKMPKFQNGCPVIFNIDGQLFSSPLAEGVMRTILFHEDIGTNTVLINVLGETVNFTRMQTMQEEVSCREDGEPECTPTEGYTFSPELVSNLLWNFPEAKTIQFGEAHDSPLTWQGSILAPLADNVLWNYSGHRGRFVVGGNVEVNNAAFVAMNFPFDPEACPLRKSPEYECTDVLPLATEVCVDDYLEKENGLSACPFVDVSIVSLAGSVGYPSEAFVDGSGIIYGIRHEEGTIKFNVNNPFAEAADVFVKHNIVQDGSGGWLESRCDASMDQDHCLRDRSLDTTDRMYEVACVRDHATVYVYFASRDPTLKEYQATDGVEGATIDRCCYPPEYTSEYAVAEYSYHIKCSCPQDDEPQDAVRKNLRH